jgi:hypothetical protein
MRAREADYFRLGMLAFGQNGEGISPVPNMRKVTTVRMDAKVHKHSAVSIIPPKDDFCNYITRKLIFVKLLYKYV